MRPVEVTIRQPVPLADKCQRLARVEVLEAGAEVGTGVAIAGRMVEADLDAAKYLGQFIKAVEVDLCEVVDVHAGQLFYRRNGRGTASLVAQECQLVLTYRRVLGAELLLLVVHADAVGLVDLPALLRADHVRERDPVVAWDREADRALPAREYVNQDESICSVTAGTVFDLLPVARVQRAQNVVGQDVAVPVCAALETHQQDVLGSDGRSADDGVRGANARDAVDEEVRETAEKQGKDGGNAAHGVCECPRDRTLGHSWACHAHLRSRAIDSICAGRLSAKLPH